MTDKELIKEEIKRLDDKYRELRVSGTTQEAKEADLVVHVLLQISNFIESLPEEPANEDLEEEIKRYFHEVCDRDNTVGEYYKILSNWQKQQMMKDTVEGEVRKGYVGNQIVVSSKDGSAKYVAFDASYADAFCVGDKVKIIIVKEKNK